MDHQTAATGFGFGMDFSNVDFSATDFTKTSEGNTQTPFIFGDESFGDEGIDTTTCASFDQSFGSMNTPMYSLPLTDSAFSMQQNLAMDNTLVDPSAWNGQLDFPTAPAQSFGSYQPFNSNMKRPLQVDTQEYPQSKRHEGAEYASNLTSPFLPSASLSTPSWTVDTQTTPASASNEVGLSDEAADVCATWFSKYAVLPNDMHIESLSQLTGEPASAIRVWFGQMLKQGIAGHDSAYKSQTSLSQPELTMNDNTTRSQTDLMTVTCAHETTTSPPLRGGKKGCTPTNNPELLSRDPNKIYQCTRKCGKRYGRKCDWKRNEEEGYPSKSWICSLCVSQGVEKVKPCFRRYHFSQHFRNIHAGIDSAEYEESSFVQSETAFPRRCGFCPHRFESRQDRIDHIAAHFKKGKCMLDWKDEEDDNNNSDDHDGNDDDDDSSDGHHDQSGSSGEGPAKHGYSGGKSNGGGNNSNGGGSGGGSPFHGLGQFQLSMSERGGAKQSSLPLPDDPQGVPSGIKRIITEGSTTDASPTGEGTFSQHSSCSPSTEAQGLQGVERQQPAQIQEKSKQNVDPEYPYSFAKPEESSFSSPISSGDEEAARNDAHAVARDALSRCLTTHLQTRTSSTTSQNVESSIRLEKKTSSRTGVPDDQRQISEFRGRPSPSSSLSQQVNSDLLTDTQGYHHHEKSSTEVSLETLVSSHTELGPGIGHASQHQSLTASGNQIEVEPSDMNTLQDLQDLIQASQQGIGIIQVTSSGVLPNQDVPARGTEALKGTAQVASEPSESWEAPNGSGKSDILLPIAGLHAPFKESTLDRLIETTPPDTPPDRTGCGTERLSSPDSCESIARRDGAYLKSQSFLSVKLLGTGGFSTVDEVVHRETRLRISRKTLKNREQSALEELKKEVNVLQKLRHPHIIRYLGAYSKDDKVSILLSPVAETNLAVWLDKCYLEKPAGLADTVIKMFGCLASSIRYLHEQRPVIKHMDIKPQNILVMNGSHDIPHVVLSDFGISSAETGKLGETATPLTRQYCAPEVSARASRGQAADIWSLGCVFLEMLAAAYHGENAQWLGFRKEFSGRKGKYYWEDVPRLHEWLVGFLDQAANYTEATVLRTVKSMVRKEPVERPSAAMLTILFAPAPCCLSWPNEKASFPAPQEEVELAEMILREAAADGLDDTLSGLLKLTKSLGGQVTTLLGGRDETSSFESAKAWLKDCLENHDACRQQTVTPKALPTRLIDLRPEGLAGSRLRLISSIELPGGSDATYAAISHTWTDQDLTLSSGRLKEMQASLLREQLPKALNDAIAVADRIGHRYIWVDSLCVIQDSAEDKRKECAMMASTYRNAVVTIVADTADTSPGPVQINKPAGNPAHWEAPGFAWDTRPWCLQERLLCGRLLHLTKGQMYWDCHSLKASETFPHGLPSLVWEKVHTRPGSGPSHTGLLSKVTRVEAPAVIRDCKFLKKEGDSIGDAMSAQMQMTLKAHSPSNVGGEEQHRNRNCRRDQAGQPPLCSARTSGHPFCADRLADALDSYRRTSFSPNPSSFLPGDEGFNTITNETENEEKNSKKGTENSKCGCGGLVSRPIEGEDCSSLSLRGSCGRKRCGGGFAGCRGMT